MRARALLFGAAAVLLRLIPIFDPDYFWHVHTGRWIWTHRAIPTTDVFSHTFHGAPWRFVDWLPDVALYLLWSAAGHAGVVVATAILGGLLVALAVLYTGPSAAAGALLLGAIVDRVTPRPQLASFLCFAAMLHLLSRARRRPQLLALVPLVVAVWQNLHASAVLGVALAGAFLVGAEIDRRRGREVGASTLHAALAVAGACAALFLTPRPIDRLQAVLLHTPGADIGEFITEWAPIWGAAWSAPSSIALYVLAALALVALLTRRVEGAFEVIVALALAWMAARSIRFIPMAAIALGPLAAAGLADRSKLVRVPAFVAGVWASLAVARAPGLGIKPDLYPEGASAFLRANPPRGAMWNELYFGGYLLFALDGRFPVSLDGRSFAVYDPRFVREAALAEGAELVRLLDVHRIGFVVLPTTSASLDLFQRASGWTLVYFDDIAFVAVRDRENPDLSASHGYREIHPGQWPKDLDALSADAARTDSARAEADRAVREAPGSALARVVRAAVATASNDARTADADLEQAFRRRPAFLPALGLRLLRCVRAGDAACVCPASAAVLEASPKNRTALDARATFGCGP